MKFKWLDTGQVDSFAQWVVAELVRRLPPASFGPADKKLGERLHRMNEVVSERATALAFGERLNFYKRAPLPTSSNGVSRKPATRTRSLKHSLTSSPH